MKKEDVLSNSHLINQLNKKDINKYIAIGSFKLVKYKKNSVVHFEGDLCNKLEVILAGKVVVEHFDETGRLNTVMEFGVDKLLGCNLIFSENPHFPATVATKEPSVILEIKKELLLELLKNTSFLLIFLRSMSHHTSMLFNVINLNGRKTIRESIMNFLKYERKKQNSNYILLNTTKKALADQIGVQRTSLSRELANMRDDGLITFDSKSITIKYR